MISKPFVFPFVDPSSALRPPVSIPCSIGNQRTPPSSHLGAGGVEPISPVLLPARPVTSPWTTYLTLQYYSSSLVHDLSLPCFIARTEEPRPPSSSIVCAGRTTSHSPRRILPTSVSPACLHPRQNCVTSSAALFRARADASSRVDISSVPVSIPQPSHTSTTMPTQRPFLANFLAAFRSSQPLPTSITNPAAAVTSTASIWTSAAQSKSPSSQSPPAEEGPTSPRPINAKPNPYNTPSATAVSQDRQLHSPRSPLQHNVSTQTHLPKPQSPSAPSLQPSYPTCQEVGRRKARRGSDSSADSGGFREVKTPGGESWFIGGRTAGGEEKYYKLSMIKRDKSSDRISTDQLSL